MRKVRTPCCHPLLARWPRLQGIPTVQLFSDASPVTRLSQVEREIGAQRLYLKRDDRLQAPFAGCKVRNLEFLLGEAKARSATAILTCGSQGSNHVAATAFFGSRMGLKVRAVLSPQRWSQDVERNLEIAASAGADLVPVAPGGSLRMNGDCMRDHFHRLRAAGDCPHNIPFGGCDPRSGIAHVNAAFELAEQCRRLDMEPPRRLYLAAASLNTAAGLALGIRLADLPTRVFAVAVTDTAVGNQDGMCELAKGILDTLRRFDSSVPKIRLRRGDFEIRDGRLGKSFGAAVDEARTAASIANRLEGIYLDGCYTAKAFAIALRELSEGDNSKSSAMFWHTGMDLAAEHGEANVP